MSTFKRAEICGIASCGLFVAALACAQPVAPDSATPSPQAAAGEYEHGRQETTIRIAGRDQVMTLEEAERIRLTVETYLAEEKPDLEPGVFGPGEAFVDGQGNIRLGAWILESAYGTEKPELNLTFRVLTNEHFIVRQIIYLALEDGQWKVTGEDRQTAHLRY